MTRTKPASLPLSTIAGQTTFRGCLAVLDIPHAVLWSTLPPGLELPGDSACPCLLVFGEQTDGTAFFAGIPVPWGAHYHELMVALPFVRRKGAAEAFLLVLGMACDAWWAVWNGNVYYGFRKRLTQLSWDGERFVVTGDGHQPSFDATLRSRGAASDGRLLAWMQAAVALPVLGHRRDGLFVRSQFEWDFREAEVEAATLRLAVGQTLPELPLGSHTAYQDNAYLVRRLRWRLSWPGAATRPPSS